MVYKNILLASALASTLMADTLTMSKDGLGDFLISPFYMAKDKICSEINVMNTNEVSSILAKVAIREHVMSNEIDLPIFLSPGDSWSGTICQNGDDVYLKSCDDSNHPQVAEEFCTTGKNISLHSKNAGHSQTDFTSGYVEIYPIAQFNEQSTKKVDKEVLVNRWDTLASGKNPDNKLKLSGVDGYSLTANVNYLANNYLSASAPFIAFKGAHDKQVRGSAIAYGNDTSPQILLGQDKTIDILKVLQNDKVIVDYNNGGDYEYIVLTFPFSYSEKQTRTYKVTVRNMEADKDEQVEEVVIFSPKPIIEKPEFSTSNEVSFISIKDIISKTSDPKKFKKGMIQIQDITNDGDYQLGYNKKASFIASKFVQGSVVDDPKTNTSIDSVRLVRVLPSH